MDDELSEFLRLGRARPVDVGAGRRRPLGAAAGALAITYDHEDLPRSTTRGGTRTTYELDASSRRRASTTGSVGGTAAMTLVRHDADESDNPAWVDETRGGITTRTRYATALGGKQRGTADSGLQLMGVRLANPVTGQFTSKDPVHGGGATAFAYPTDPVNELDLDGRSWSKALEIVKAIKAARTLITSLGGARNAAKLFVFASTRPERAAALAKARAMAGKSILDVLGITMIRNKCF
jgi:RHS repeat-associated protein